MKEIFEQLIQHMNIGDFSIDVNEKHKRLNIFIHDESLVKNYLPVIVSNFNHLGLLLAKKTGSDIRCIDVNNYRRERERLISEIARAAARKAIATKESVNLPAMNSYERRLVHTELAMRPDISTSSSGVGKDRYVIISPILNN